MTSRSRKSRRTTATAPSSEIWTIPNPKPTPPPGAPGQWFNGLCTTCAASFILAGSILAGLISAQEAAGPGILKPPSPSKSEKDCSRAPRSRYQVDLSQIKHATLESEAVFFERMEKEKKLEAMETLVSDAKTKLQSVRRYMLPPGLDHLQDSAQLTAQAHESLCAVEKNLNAARADLRDYHQRTTPQALAIAAGRVDAAPLLGKIRREIRAAEHGLRSLKEFTFVEGQKKIDDANKGLNKTVQPLPADDPSRPKFQQAVADLQRATAALSEATKFTSDLIESLEKARREYLPECSSGVESAMLRPLERVKDFTTQSIQNAEEAADAVLKLRGGGLARQREAVVENLLQQVDEQLTDIRQLLTGECEEQTTTCENCGKVTARIRRVMDPAAACARAEPALLQAEEMINQALGQTEEMAMRLAEVKPADDPVQNLMLSLAVRGLRGDPEHGDLGVKGNLSLALERGKQFREQRFEFFPSQAYPTEIEPAQPRAFPPMQATYVAREEWHYPAYFEDINLERYGNRVPVAQPFLSYGKFLADLAFLPYKVWLDRPYERQYTLGLYRPGDEVPYMIYLPEPNLKAAAFEAGVWTGLIFFP
ncbi:MAG: hypothetical protein HY000_14550 [Planctomycetes bacterium]|nr:hypothetical protein [Planctomycetota bacterium]